MAKTYTNEELNALVAEFSAEFDTLVKAEVAKTEALRKADGEDEPKKDGPPASESASGASDDSAAPPAASASPAPDASAASPDPAASAAPVPDPASAGADPAAQASGGDPMAALSQAYAQLSPEELQMHFEALKQVLMSQQAAAGAVPAAGAGAPMAPPAAPAADPMAAAAGAPPMGAPPAPAGMGGGAPMAGEGSKPLDPAATMALKSEHEKEMSLVKSERDASATKVAELEKSLSQLTETMTKVLAQPIRKSVTGKDIDGLLEHEKQAPKFESMSKAEVTKKLLTVARDPALKKADRDLINKYYNGTTKVDAIAHLLG